MMLKFNTLFFPLSLLSAISSDAQYLGTASVTQGPGDTTAVALYTCTGGRPTNLGSILASDSTQWTVPAAVSYSDPAFPFASDLYNSCNGATFANTSAALASLNGSDIVNVDSAGEVFTAFVFADNYFEMYIDGVPVGKDRVPYTQFNSSIIRFRATRPFTIAMLLVDWEEHLGLGYETNNAFTYYVGDGGMVMMLKDAAGNVIDITGPAWKAQTFYTAPIVDPSCAFEQGNERRSDTCSTTSTNNGAQAYGLHWQRPTGWSLEGFDDSSWPNAYIFSNATVGINNKPAYTNFTDVFDDPLHDAQFIWSSNLLLDNEVLVRHTVPPPSPTGILLPENEDILIFPNPSNGTFFLLFKEHKSAATSIEIVNLQGEKVFCSKWTNTPISISGFNAGVYTVRIHTEFSMSSHKLIIR